MNKTVINAILKKGNHILNKLNNDTLNAQEVNNNVLYKIINYNKNTEYGKKYNYSKIHDVEDFINNVPLNTYMDFKCYIDKIYCGEKNILTKDDIAYFSRTSGTTGNQKFIPVTKNSRKCAKNYMGALTEVVIFNNLKSKWYYGKGVMLSDMVVKSKSENGIPIGAATSGGMKSIKNIIPLIWTTPMEVLELEDKETALYLHILFALANKDLTYIGATFISSILDFFRVMEENWNILIYDIGNGKVNENLNIDEAVRKKLNSYLIPMKIRANKLRIEGSKGFKGIARRVWNHLMVITTVTGGPFKIYDDKVKYYIENVPIYSSAYAASECTIGINLCFIKPNYVIIPDSAFFEFIKVKDMDRDNIKTYMLSELSIGEEYEIVITNKAGLYRYRMGDIVKVVGFYNNSPEVEFLYRKNQCLNMVSEKTTEEHINVAINNTMKKLNLEMIDYTTRPDNSRTPGRYIFYIELKVNKCSKLIIENKLDSELKLSNKAYERFRDYNKLNKPKVILLSTKSFEKIKLYMISKGTSKYQLKIPRVINKEEMIKFIENI